ncbi:hypothetical protein [Ascidiaceihabitans sp.]|uniref:hypothetical protein n=1 Tax=Ascidiaceihabitans sp. TaxID=1872644 RepID=UPI00329A55A8
MAWDETGQKFCTPDGLLGITYQGKSRIYVLELHHRTPTKLVVDQLYRNFRAARVIGAKFSDYPTGSDPYVLSVFTNQAELAAVKRRLDGNDVFETVQRGLISCSMTELTDALENRTTKI